MLKSRKPVISICAVRTGCGKSQMTRYLCDLLRRVNLVPVVVRHPMPYGNLASQEVERFAHFEDLSLYRCTIEEREEYEPLLTRAPSCMPGSITARFCIGGEGRGFYLWDGGNNDFPFFVPDLEIALVDPLRPGDETGYFPGEVNLRRATIVVINKSNTVRAVLATERDVHTVNPDAGCSTALRFPFRPGRGGTAGSGH